MSKSYQIEYIIYRLVQYKHRSLSMIVPFSYNWDFKSTIIRYKKLKHGRLFTVPYSNNPTRTKPGSPLTTSNNQSNMSK